MIEKLFKWTGLLLLAVVVASILYFPLFIIMCFVYIKSLPTYFKAVAVGVDQLGGSILYKQPDWTVSSWTYIRAQQSSLPHIIFMKFIDLLFGKDHCYNSYVKEAGGCQCTK